MTIYSGPVGSNDDVKGSEYNALRNDIIAGHTHSGNGDGSVIDFNDITINGNPLPFSWSEVDTNLNTVMNGIAWAVSAVGVHDHVLANNLAFPYIVNVTFPNGITFADTNYVLTVTLQPVGTVVTKMSVFPVISEKTTTGFQLFLYGGASDGTATYNPRIWPDGIDTPPAVVKVNYMAVK